MLAQLQKVQIQFCKKMDPYQASKETEKICRLAPVIPVLVVHDSGIAKPLAEALISGGLPVLEVTLRHSLH